MARKAKHRQAIVDAAVALFRKQGYAATGLNEIVEASGAPKGSLYYYFPKGKASIAVAAVEEAGRRVVETIEALASGARDTGELVQRHAMQLGAWMKKSNYRDGCPITTVLLELAPQDRAVTAAGRAAYDARIKAMTESLLRDGHDPARARRMAQFSCSALQGALIQSRIERSSQPLQLAAEELAPLFAAMRPGTLPAGR